MWIGCMRCIGRVCLAEQLEDRASIRLHEEKGSNSSNIKAANTAP